jgi:hypothetical protein
MMNDALKQFISDASRPITETSLRKILKEILPAPQKRVTTPTAGTVQKRAAR